jgi:protein-disulfide isomerase
MQPKSLDKEPVNKAAQSSRNQIMNDIAKGAFVVLCLAGAYKLMFTPDPQPVDHIAEQVQTTALPVAVDLPTAKLSAQYRALNQIDEQKLGQLIKEREVVVAAEGKVVFSPGKPATQAPTAQPAVAPSHLTVAESSAPASAAASGQETPGIMAKVGFKKDGSPMTEPQKRAQIQDALAKIPDDFTVEWKAPQEKASIYVFTDPTCPFCQKLHNAIPQLNAAGITVHYLMYPRDMGRLGTGSGESVTQKNLNNVWCSADQKAAMDDAYAGFKVPAADCAALPSELKRIPPPIAQQYFLGNVFGVNGTPSVFTADGKDLPGFQSAEKLISETLN